LLPGFPDLRLELREQAPLPFFLELIDLFFKRLDLIRRSRGLRFIP
jgi:hypothetical protein